METDRNAIIASISKQISDRSLLYPFIYGRSLYDKYFELFAEQGRSYLPVADTQRLLNGTPQGVFQEADLVTGPFGVLKSRTYRSIPATTDIPLRNCQDPSCNRVHHVVLSTDSEAEINKNREIIQKIMARDNKNERTWVEFVRSIVSQYLPIYKEWSIEPILILIGDALTD